MNNLSSYCGLVDAKIRASDKDLPVPMYTIFTYKPRFSSFWESSASLNKKVELHIMIKLWGKLLQYAHVLSFV